MCQLCRLVLDPDAPMDHAKALKLIGQTIEKTKDSKIHVHLSQLIDRMLNIEPTADAEIDAAWQEERDGD